MSSDLCVVPRTYHIKIQKEGYVATREEELIHTEGSGRKPSTNVRVIVVSYSKYCTSHGGFSPCLLDIGYGPWEGPATGELVDGPAASDKSPAADIPEMVDSAVVEAFSGLSPYNMRSSNETSLLIESSIVFLGKWSRVLPDAFTLFLDTRNDTGVLVKGAREESLSLDIDVSCVVIHRELGAGTSADGTTGCSLSSAVIRVGEAVKKPPLEIPVSGRSILGGGPSSTVAEAVDQYVACCLPFLDHWG